MCDDKWIEQRARLVAENIICISKEIGYESQPYAESLIVCAIKDALKKEMEDNKWNCTSTRKKR